jgi:hypothetical protein
MRTLSLTCAIGLLLLGACGPGGDDGDGACADIVVGELVITEVFGDHAPSAGGSGGDEGKEWFEIYNASGAAIDLEGLTIVHSRPDGGSDHAHRMASVTVDAGGYLVLGNVLPEFVDGHLDYGYADELGDIFNSDGGRIAITCGDEVIDEILYDVVESGASTGFDGGAPPDYTANDDLGLWCATPDEDSYAFEPDNFGTPGAANFDCAGGIAGMCDDGGTLRPTVTPAAGDLIITEALPAPSTPQDLKEWIEVYVVNPVDLNGIQIARANGNADTVNAEECLAVTAGTYLVFGKTAEAAMNGSLPRVDGIFDFSLVDDARILDPGGAVIDAVTFTGAGTAESFQLDFDFFDATANDDERYWCDATIAWAGADLGSPGAANEECTILPPAGMCVDPDTATERDIVEPTVGQIVLTEVHPNPSGTDSQQEWIEARTTAAIDLNGLKLARTGNTPGSFQILSSDCIEIPADTYVLFGRTGATGLPPADVVYSGFDLVDTCSVSNTCDIRVTLGDDTLLDAITWTDADGVATGGLSARQLDLDFVADPLGNDTEANWCDATTPYNGGLDNGTPRAENLQCP